MGEWRLDRVGEQLDADDVTYSSLGAAPGAPAASGPAAPRDRLPSTIRDARPRRRTARRLVTAVGVLLAMVGLGYAGLTGWELYRSQAATAGIPDIPVIRADVSPIRIQPEEPGGLQVPHRDRLVLQDLDDEPMPMPVATVRPAPEEPMPRPVAEEPVAEAPVVEAPIAEGAVPGTDLADAPADTIADAAAAEAPDAALNAANAAGPEAPAVEPVPSLDAAGLDTLIEQAAMGGPLEEPPAAEPVAETPVTEEPVADTQVADAGAAGAPADTVVAQAGSSGDVFIQAPQTGTGPAVGTGPTVGTGPFIRRIEEPPAPEPPPADDGGAEAPAEGPTSIITTRPDEEPTPIILPIIRERVIRSGRDERYEEEVAAPPAAPPPATEPAAADPGAAADVARPMRPVPSGDAAPAGDLPTVIRDGVVSGDGDSVEALIPRRTPPPEPAARDSEAAEDTATDEPPADVVPLERAEAASPVVESPPLVAPAAAPRRPVSPELTVGAVQALGDVDASVAMIADPQVATALPLPLSWSAALNRATTGPGRPDASDSAPATPQAAAAPAPATTAAVAAPARPEAAAVAPQTDPAGTHRVQVVAVQSQAQAESEWQRISRLYPDLLGGSELFIQQIDLGDRGIWYRVQAGTFARSDANQVCATIQARGGDCIVRER